MTTNRDGKSRILIDLLDNGPIWGAELARRIGRDQSRVSAHLKTMKENGLVQRKDVLPTSLLGGRLGKEWSLTTKGTDIATALKEMANNDRS